MWLRSFKIILSRDSKNFLFLIYQYLLLFYKFFFCSNIIIIDLLLHHFFSLFHMSFMLIALFIQLSLTFLQ